MISVKNYIDDFLHLFFPHNCAACSTDIINAGDTLCAECLSLLPETGFFLHGNNPVENMFYGRMKIEKAGSAFYFTKDSVIKNVIIQLKYKNNIAAGEFLGKLLGRQLATSNRFDDIDIIIPMPLNEKKLFKRGYNQSAIIADGIVSVWNKPVITNAVERILFTETQTHKTRIDRWQTMENVFAVSKPEMLTGKHILLVDDIVTTGATFEACGQAILKIPGTALSLASVACTI
ncbi:ComF family protein [Parafilimonas terrae]|uniref:ComF family protein n=1 Tax=Parafilimonas terrae TaxID=1465490 RepID=A0A1I5ZFB9_9BACT|nr:ComF family protein [Parafilimonas terrae]SFQ55121.1 comF family protein [Parafilimonas terrae]